MDMEQIEYRFDSKDAQVEVSNSVAEEYAQLGRSYIQDNSISKGVTFQFIMSPFMFNLLAESDFMRLIYTTYNENCELKYLLNYTAFDYATMRWMPVARMRADKEDTAFYVKGFELVEQVCKYT